MKPHISLRNGVGALLALWVLIIPLSAWAVLGDNAASVLTDQSRLKGTLRSSDHSTYVLHEITSSSGAAVREYATPGGAVFAVAWDGQVPPDLQQLLGPYYQQAQQAQVTRKATGQQVAAQDGTPVRRSRAPIAIETSGLVLYQTGHMRSFHGVAYIPQLVPQSMKTSDIR